MDQFDFDDIDGQTPKKNNIKQIQKEPPNKNNKISKNDDFFDFQVNQKAKPTQSKKNHFQYNNVDTYLDEGQKKDFAKKNSQKNKQNQSTLPRLNISKSPQQKINKSKMDLSLQELPEKRVMVQKQQKKVKKQSQQFDYAVYGTSPQDMNKKSQLKTNIIPQKLKLQEKILIEPKLSPKNIPKSIQIPISKINNTLKKQVIQKQKHQISQDQYEQEYEQEIAQSPKKISNIKNKSPQKQITKNISQKINIQQQKIQSLKKDQPKQITNNQKQSKALIKQKSQHQKQLPITKYKQMVEKSFPDEQSQQKVKKLKPDSINRLNDKMRQMIKGFSSELTDLIDKNLLLLRKPQNQIKQEIQGQPVDPIQAQIKLLEQTKKNNQKILQMSQKQLQNTTKMNQKISNSVQTNVQVTQDIQAFKKHIGIMSRQISNLKNQVQKQGKKVTKIQQNSKKSSNDQNGGVKFKSVIEINQKLANTRLQFERNKKKTQQLNQKQKGLEQKINQVQSKRNQALSKAEAQGISFYSKQQKKRYEQFKKKREQLMLFQSKYKSSIKSKQTLIQHEMSDIEVLIEDYQKRYDLLNQQAQLSRKQIFSQIIKAKRNPKLNPNTKQILIQLQKFMNEDQSSQSEQPFSSLNYISENIYKKQYNQQKNNSKSLTEQKQLKKVAYKNYIQQVARINEDKKNKFTTQRRNSQINPFRKAITPNQSTQPNHIQDKMNRTKQNNVQTVDKQKQRVWKSSNTQTLIRNPLKKDVSKSRYQNEKQKEEQNPLNNKQIMKLIDKNKQKIILKQQEKLKTQENSISKKPFTFRASMKDKQILQNQLADIPKQMQKIQKAIQNKRNQITKDNQIDDLIGIKLKDKQIQGISATMQLKQAVNNTPFRNLKLKKDKQKQGSQNIISQSKFKSQIQKPFIIEKQKQKQKTIAQTITEKIQQIKQNITQVQDANTFKPKRFNLRNKKNQSLQNNGGYMPTARINNEQQIQKVKQKQLQSEIKIPQHRTSMNKPVQSKIMQNKKQQQQFDPFKKFMNNKQQKSFTFGQNKQPETLKLNTNQQATIVTTNKPRMNLFKKTQLTTPIEEQKKNINNKQLKKQQPIIQQQKFINPYAKQQPPKQEGIKIQKQGKVKKINPLNNNTNKNKNIFGDVQDATINNNILSLGQPQAARIKPQLYAPKSIRQDKELNVNDLLGIKKKQNNIDKDLILDLPNDNKISIKKKNGGKANDFFGDMDI